MSKPELPDNASSLLARHSDELLRFATLVLGSQDDAQDVLQDAFLRLSKMMNATTVRNPRALLFTIVGNLSRDLLRRRNRWAMSELPEHLTTGDDPITALLGIETATRIGEVVDSLPPRCREVFSLRKGHDLSYREIAARLGISEKTVENHLAAAMRALRQSVLTDSTGGSASTKRLNTKGTRSDD